MSDRISLNDTCILNLDTLQWSTEICSGDVPSPRSRHSANLMKGRKIAVFGGTDGVYEFSQLIHLDQFEC